MDTKLSSEQLQTIADTLYGVVTDPKVKIRWGARLREEIRAQLQKGLKPSGYRADWIRDTQTALIDTLYRQGEAFNQKYRHDLISVNDMADALLSALARLQTAVKKAQEQEGLD